MNQLETTHYKMHHQHRFVIEYPLNDRPKEQCHFKQSPRLNLLGRIGKENFRYQTRKFIKSRVLIPKVFCQQRWKNLIYYFCNSFQKKKTSSSGRNERKLYKVFTLNEIQTERN